MLVVYFKNDTLSFRGQGLPLQMISAKLLKRKITNLRYLRLEAKNEKSKKKEYKKYQPSSEGGTSSKLRLQNPKFPPVSEKGSNPRYVGAPAKFC